MPTKTVVSLFVLLTAGLPALAEDGRPVLRFGAMTELSGAGAAVGTQCKNGFELARNEFAPGGRAGGRSIEIIYADTQGLPTVGVTEFRRLAEVNKVQAVLLKRSAVGMPVNPLSKDLRLPIIGLVGPKSFTSDNPYAFRFYPTAESIGQKLAALAAARGKTAALVSLEDEWQLAIREAFRHDFKERGGSIVLDELLQAAETEVSTLGTRVKKRSGQLLVVNLGPGQTGLFVKRVREQGVAIPLLGNYYLGETSEVEKAGAANIEGSVVVDLSLHRRPVFAAAFKNLFPEAAPDSTAYTCYSGMALLLQSIAESPEADSREGVYQALLKKSRITLSDGSLAVVNREIQYDLAGFKVHNKRMEVLEE